MQNIHFFKKRVNIWQLHYCSLRSLILSEVHQHRTPGFPGFNLPLTVLPPRFPRLHSLSTANSVPTRLTHSYFGGSTHGLGRQPEGQPDALLTATSRRCSPGPDTDWIDLYMERMCEKPDALITMT